MLFNVVQRIFDFFVYPYQWQLIAISKNLRLFFNKHFSNSIKFWNFPSGSNWPLHTSVDSDIKKFNLILLFPCKMLWDFNKKEECNNIIKTSRWHFKHDFKGKHFLDFLDNELYLVILLYIKEGPWIKYFGHSNLLCARVTHTITNHAPIGGYHLRFFPNEDFSCLYKSYPIKTQHYILHNYRRFNKYMKILHWLPN